jgi:hypothetical protein
MEMKQIYGIINTVSQEVLGESVLVQEDLGNIVDIGTAVFDNNSFDKFVRSLVDHIGRVVFVDRVYRGRVPSIVRDGWEYGAVLEKLACKLPEAQENESWELQSGTSYDPNVFIAPVVTAHFYNKKVTFEIQISIVERQFRSAFSSGSQAASFIAMIFNAIENSMTIKLDALIMRTICNMIGETVYDDFGANAITGGSGVKAVNVLKLYNDTVAEADALTAANCMQSPAFLRFASNLMKMYKDRLAVESTLFNIDGEPRFTPADRLHFVVLSEFAAGVESYLQSDTFHDEMVALPEYESVPFWQGSGTGYAFTDTGKVYVTTASNHAETVTGVLGVMFDSDAAAVCNMDRRTTSQYNAKGEFTNNFFKMDCQYLNSLQENFVVFFAAAA